MGYEGPGISVKNYNYGVVEREVLQTLNKCELKRNSPRLLVDDYTYPVVQASYKPMLISYVALLGLQDGLIWARKVGSSGMIVRCVDLGPQETRSTLFAIKQNGALCCMAF
jgi:hypothetical protein